jgi:hypothetical protein
MIPARYANSFVQRTPILLGKNQTQYGVLLSEYQVTDYWDVRTTSSGSMQMRAYVVAMQQRLTLYNDKASGFGGPSQGAVFTDYPVMAVQQVAPATTAPGVSFYLEDYSPKTLNAAVSTSRNAATDSNTSSSVQHTTGSSTSVTNTWEVSGSLGFFGDVLTGGVGGGYSSSTTHTDEQSQGSSEGAEAGSSSGASSSMTIKDWASYAFLDKDRRAPSWVWGQENPWNVIDFRNSTDNSTIDLPPYVQQLLCDGKYVYPPSHIAQFGLDFVARAKWIFYLAGPAGADDEVADFSHALTYWTGSHSGTGSFGTLALSVSMDQLANNLAIETIHLNLPCLALRAITRAGSGNGAVVGFVKSEFITVPGPSPAQFRVTSAARNLYISQGQGFDAFQADDSVLTGGNITAANPASFLLRFKVVDPDLELSLHLRHWKTTDVGCLMTLQINGHSITRHIDTANAGGGSDNVTTVILRSLDYTNPDIYDYLTVGMNEIQVTIVPADAQQSCGYALRALAIQ